MIDPGAPLLYSPDIHLILFSVIRLLAAAIFGGIIGLQRQRVHSTAGLRTHMLVCLGSAFFVLTVIEAGAAISDVSRVIQGIVSGIGFLGAGTILKLGDRAEVHGLTTAASIWLTAAVGHERGTGPPLAASGRLDPRMGRPRADGPFRTAASREQDPAADLSLRRRRYASVATRIALIVCMRFSA